MKAHLEDGFLLRKISELIMVSDIHFKKKFLAFPNIRLKGYVKTRGLPEANKKLLRGRR